VQAGGGGGGGGGGPRFAPDASSLTRHCLRRLLPRPLPPALTRRCFPSKDAFRWSISEFAGCDDGNECTFFDRCTNGGACAGIPDDCLRKIKTGKDFLDCETCGVNKCAMQKMKDGKTEKGCVLFKTSTSWQSYISCTAGQVEIVRPGYWYTGLCS
jgi:hypothetical protein